MLMAFSSHRQKIAAARRPSITPSNGLEMANQKETSQPESWAIAFVFMLFFSSVRRSTFHKREISFETLNEVRRIWIAGSGLED
jgi:hypothetical protein